MRYDPLYTPYPSRRNPVYGSRGMVATSHPLASQAGLEILKQGGNAIDAAIATAAALTVVEPTSNGLGSDCFSIIFKDGKLKGFNGSGRAPLAFKPKEFRRLGLTEMPDTGWASATVPAAPAAWAAMVEKMGRLGLSEILAPAIELAENGHAVAPTVAHNWALNFNRYSKFRNKPEFKAWFDTFAPDGRAPHAGELWKCPDLANTLRSIAESNAEDFYKGQTALKILEHSMKSGGYLCVKDFDSVAPEWVSPLSASYRGYDIWELPPNGQGLTVLMALNILNGFAAQTMRNPADMHRQIEAIKLAFADARRYIADPRIEDIPIDGLLNDEYAAERRALISEKASVPEAGEPENSGTVYLCTADNEGNMVSFIQSNYKGFGSGIVIPGTGISLNCRAASFTLEEGHPNIVAPGIMVQ